MPAPLVARLVEQPEPGLRAERALVAAAHQLRLFALDEASALQRPPEIQLGAPLDEAQW